MSTTETSTTAFNMRRKLSAMTCTGARLKKKVTRSSCNRYDDEDLPASYTQSAAELENLEKRLACLIRLQERSGKAWDNVLKQQRKACDIASRSYTRLTPLHHEAKNTRDRLADELNTRDSQKCRYEDDMKPSTRAVRAYLTELEDVRRSFDDVETALVQMKHYDAKLARLRRSRNARMEKLNSNRSKLEEAKAKFRSKLNNTEAMIMAALKKKDAFVQAALYSFWAFESAHLEPAFEATKSIRSMVHRRKDSIASLDNSVKNPEPVTE